MGDRILRCHASHRYQKDRRDPHMRSELS
jgi:hypothetical protein